MRPRAAAGPCRDTCSRFGKGSTCERVMEKRGAGFQVVASVPNKAGQLCLPAPPPGPPPSSQCLPRVLHPDAPVPQGLGPGHRAGLARQLEDGTGRSGEVRQCRIQTGAGQRGGGGRSSEARLPSLVHVQRLRTAGRAASGWGLRPGGAVRPHSSSARPSCSRTVACPRCHCCPNWWDWVQVKVNEAKWWPQGQDRALGGTQEERVAWGGWG